MGMGATDVAGRVLASLGALVSVKPEFSPAADVPNAGVLAALPALREKLRLLTSTGHPEQWSAELCKQWMQDDPEATGLFYIDGHVRVYHGSQTEWPRRYVSRQRLCLRGTTDYWINALDAQALLRGHQGRRSGDGQGVKVIEEETVPRIERGAPELVSEPALIADRLRHRFVLVFDRERYSPVLFGKMKQRRIACLTYRRSPGSDWPAEECSAQPVTLTNGETVEMMLAERGVYLERSDLWAREIRRRTDSGHQTPMISTDYVSPCSRLAGAMLGRWGQENFFRSMLEHFGLDHLATHQLEPIPATTRVVNPVHRALEAAVRKRNACPTATAPGSRR